MIIDLNTYLGHWPFRELRHNTATTLLKLMDGKGIDRAAVSSASAIFYKNPQGGNEQLVEEICPHRDRLIPFAIINPTYADWEYDLRVCVEEFGVRGLRLYPNYHNYTLSDTSCRELVRAATERGLPLSIPIRATDRRQRHWLVDIPDVSLEDVAHLVKAHPDARFILLNGIGYVNSPLGQQANNPKAPSTSLRACPECNEGTTQSSLPPNYFIEISRLSAVLQSEIRQLLDNLGSDRVVFGTGMPFKYPDPALVKLEVLEATEEELEAIRWKNAVRLFGNGI